MAFDTTLVDLEEFLEALEIRNVSQATVSEWRFSCPFPNHSNGDENASAYFNNDSALFYCHGCKERGSVVDFAAFVLSVSPIEAIRLLKQKYDPGAYDPDAVSMVEEVQKILNKKAEDDSTIQPQLPESVLDAFQIDWDAVEKASWETIPDSLKYMYNRGFGTDALIEWQVGYDSITDRIVIPVRDVDGTLIGFKARAYDERNPKYLILGDKPNRKPRYGFPCYYPSKVCFGAHRLKEDSDVVICEGELNAIAVNSRTQNDWQAVAINGSYFQQAQADIIRHFAKRVVLFLDFDNAGQNAVWGWEDSKGKYHPGIIDQLKPYIPVLLVPETTVDAAEMCSDEIDDLLSRSKSALLHALRI
jgi:DNA primase